MSKAMLTECVVDENKGGEWKGTHAVWREEGQV